MEENEYLDIEDNEVNLNASTLTPLKKKPKGSLLGYANMIGINPVAVQSINYPGLITTYAEGYRPTMPNSMENYMATRQGSWAQLGNALLGQGIIGEMVGLGIEGVGSMAELFIQPFTRTGDFNNIVMSIGASIRDWSKEQFPIHRTDPDATFDMKDWGWWMDGVSSAMSTVGLLIPGMIGGKLTTTLAKRIAALASEAKGLEAAGILATSLNVGSRLSKQAENFIGAASNSVFMRNAENMSESHDTYKNTFNDAYSKFANMDDDSYTQYLNSPAGKKLLESSESDNRKDMAKAIASKASWYQYELNAGNVIFDYFQVKPLYRLGKVKPYKGFAS